MKYSLFVIVMLICAGCGEVDWFPATTAATSSSLAITTTTLPTANVGFAYSQTLTASGGKAPYTWSVTSGALPAGLTLGSGTNYGTPPTTATDTFSVTVTDSSNPVLTAVQALVIDVTDTLAPGKSVTMSIGQTIQVPSGTTYTLNGTSVTVNGSNNKIHLSAGAVVSVPLSATGPANNTIFCP